MELELGVLVRASGARADVLLQVDAGTPVAAVEQDLLARVAPGEASRALTVGGSLVGSRSPLGRPPLVRGALLEIGSPPAPAPAAVTLVCLGGPDAGRRWTLPAGEAVLGREASATVHVDDPLVSREHCTLHVDGERGEVAVSDRDTTNGTTVDGSAVTTASTALPAGAVLAVGGSRFAVAAADQDDAPTRPDSAGAIAFNRPPRRRQPLGHQPVHFPAAPVASERRPLPVLAVLAPLVLGVVLWRVLGSATFLLFTLLSPVMVIGSAVTDHRTGRRQHRRALERHRRESDEAAAQLRAEVHDDVRLRRARWPDPAATARTALAPGERLWERRRSDDDVLTVSVGVADQPSAVPVTGDPPPGATTAHGVPVVVPLTEVGVLGIAGPGSVARSLARWVTVQAAVWHSPRDLQVVVLVASSAAPDWQWTRWLPHLRPTAGQPCRALLGVGSEQVAARVAELRNVLAQRRSARRDSAPPRSVLVVVDGGPALHDLPGLRELLADGPELGVHAVVVADDRRLLPETCGALALVDGVGCATVQLENATSTGTAVDGMSVRTAEEVARALAPLRDTSADYGAAGLPRSLSWSELVELPLVGGTPDVDAVLGCWSTGGRTRALLGVSVDGPFAVDLRADGPHALVAGTTGSGKSELLQTWIASLALGNPPDALQLVLVDYKGGAAFGPCAGLPHVVGMVTDLDGALASRALASLGAELRRREALLAVSGAQDLDDHRRRGDPHQPLARLVLMVDEFASLAEDLPDFVDGLVDIARRGRSLGVHLVLATQRPGGVVSADIRANTNLRLCLAVARDTDSRDVLDAPDAAHLSRTTPGRGFVRTGYTELTAVQVARVNGPRPATAAESAPRVTLLPVVEAGDPLPGATGSAGGETELTLLVAACAAAARKLDLPASVPPWSPPLPEQLFLAELPAYDDPDVLRGGRLPPLAYGLLDLPDQQRQCPLALDLHTSTHLLVVGAPRSGRTTVLRTLAAAVARTAGPDDVHLYVADATGQGLAGLADLPHTGAVVTRGETERLERLLGWLGEEVARRQQLLAAAGCTSPAEQRARTEPAGRLPGLVLLLDGFDAFVADHADRDAGRLVDAVHALLREGPAAGLHVVITAGRGALTGRLAALVDTRLVLRLADRGDHALAGVPDRLVGSSVVPGRGWLVDADGCAGVQVAMPSPDAVRAPARPAPPASLHPPHRLLPLPDRVARADLAAPALLVPGCVVLGAGGDDGSARVADLTAGFLVAGPPGSGRSTALCTIAQQLQGGGMHVVAVAPRASPLRAVPDCVTDGDAAGALEALLGRGTCALLVDDAELLVQSGLAPVLERAVRHARDTGHLVVAAGTTDDLVLGYRGFVVDLRRSRSGVLLWPHAPADGDLLGVRLPRTGAPPRLPGRGLLCVRGAAEPVQVAT